MIPFRDLALRHKVSRRDELGAIERVLVSGRFVLGSETRRFESRFAAYVGARYAVGVASGTDAITLSLLALGIGPGDQVLVPAFTAFPTVAGIQRAGATPVPADVRPSDGLIDLGAAVRRVTRKTKAIVAVHLFGQSCNLDAAARFAARHRLFLIEDCAQSAGTRFGRRMTGSVGDCGAFSFYPTKNLAALGDGGAVTTSEARVFARLQQLRQYAAEPGGGFGANGLNSRLDEIQAAVLARRLNDLDRHVREQRRLAAIYRALLPPEICLPERSAGEASYHQFVIKTARRRALQAHLGRRGIETLVHYSYVAGTEGGLPAHRFPVANEWAARALSLPLYPGLTLSAQRRVGRAIKGFLST